jgi:hypothetical protein
MAGNSDNDADSEAKKWFLIAIIGTALYVTAVFAFVIHSDVETEGAQQTQAEGEK